MKIDVKKVRVPDTKSPEEVEIGTVRVPKSLLKAVAQATEQALQEKMTNVLALPLTDETRRQADLLKEYSWTMGRLADSLSS